MADDKEKSKKPQPQQGEAPEEYAKRSFRHGLLYPNEHRYGSGEIRLYDIPPRRRRQGRPELTPASAYTREGVPGTRAADRGRFFPLYRSCRLSSKKANEPRETGGSGGAIDLTNTYTAGRVVWLAMYLHG